uniref:Uncharacterized protein n=1 Tax=Panagrolaimus sp. PS1159 TaxID=55785 RepID=A0AC35G592_9BILA
MEPVAEIQASLENLKTVADELIIEGSDEKTEHVEVKTIKVENKTIELKERENIATEKITDEKSIIIISNAHNNGDVPNESPKAVTNAFV